jgi:alkylation response protein AidB-like acyl-CoA dehydrogenase
MPDYIAPMREIRFVLEEALDAARCIRSMDADSDLDMDLVIQILEGGGRFCREVLLPLNQIGDAQGCTLHADGSVTTPPGFRNAWERFVRTGWPGLCASKAHGGQAMPAFVGAALGEMMNATNQAWRMFPGLTHAAYQCLLAMGTPAQRDLYLPKLAAGLWTGTMCLTEPECGTDLGLMSSRAVPDWPEGQDPPLGEGAYRITGNKIYISGGEHDLSENIVHLVLARIAGAPSGTSGISLFIVPKFIPAADGSLGERNAVRCTRLSHKMGLHGNPTCDMELDGALGWLVGQPNKGLAAMFVMMNSARISVGVQSLGLMEIALQNASFYAHQRLQSRRPSGASRPDLPADPIIVQPDVRKMLLTQKAYVEGSRCLAYWLALQQDIVERHPDAHEREKASDLLALLTPVAKAFLTDNGQTCTNLALQVYGGHGYIRDMGIEQFVRDGRINQIYEGSNGIQAMDLLGRKVLADNGAKLQTLTDVIRDFIESKGFVGEISEFTKPLSALCDRIVPITREIGGKAMTDPNEIGACATEYLRLIGHLVFGYFWARMASIAIERIRESPSQPDPFYLSKVSTARFYFARIFPETESLIRIVRTGAGPVMEPDEDMI